MKVMFFIFFGIYSFLYGSSTATATLTIVATIKESISLSFEKPTGSGFNLEKSSYLDVGDVERGESIYKELPFYLRSNTDKSLSISMSSKSSGALENGEDRIDMEYSISGNRVESGGDGVVINSGSLEENSLIIKSKNSVAHNQKLGEYKTVLSFTITTA